MKLFTNKIKEISKNGDRLTFAHFGVILDSFRCWFRTVTIPVDGVRCHLLCPSPFLQLGLGKNLLKKIELLKTNLWTPSNCKRTKRLKVLKKTNVKNLQTSMGAY